MLVMLEENRSVLVRVGLLRQTLDVAGCAEGKCRLRLACEWNELDDEPLV